MAPANPASVRLRALALRLNEEAALQAALVVDARGVRVWRIASPQSRDLITCGQREGHGAGWWFFTSWHHPIARVSDLESAVTEISRYLEAES